MGDLVERLETHVQEHETLGASRCDKSLGIRKMPEGYALMLNRDETHYYWLRFDGSEGSEAWDKWYVYHSATMNSESCEIYAMLRGKLGAATPSPQPNVAPDRYIHVGYQWRARASGNDLWSPWRDGPCPALAPKGTQTEERRVFALATTEGKEG